MYKVVFKASTPLPNVIYIIVMHFDIPNYTVYYQIAIYFMYQIRVKLTVLYKIYKFDKFDTLYTAMPS